jgi:3-oxoacyl-(acyl-carrier-protein) synthase
MSKPVIIAASHANEADIESARLGTRFGRMDLLSQLVLLAVESLQIHFDDLSRDRIAVCLAVGTGSLSTDADYWEGRKTAGGFSPTLFTYTLPSAAIGELAIRHRLTGPHLCFVGSGKDVLPEAVDLIQRGEVDACICVSASVVSTGLAELISAPKSARACALFLRNSGEGLAELGEFDRDMDEVCARFRAQF